MNKAEDLGRLLCNYQIGGGKEHQRPFMRMKECEDRDRQEMKRGKEGDG